MRQSLVINIKLCKRGFSVLEISVALALIGLAMSGYISAARVNMVSQPVKATREHMAKVEEAMQKFLSMNGRLPCPAKPQVFITQAGAGFEECSAPSMCTTDKDSDVTTGTGLCYASESDGSVSGRDADGISGAINDKIIVGAVPYATLGLLGQDTLDGWGVKFKYAVSLRLTDATNYDPEMGSIYAVNAAGINDIANEIDSGYRTLPADKKFNAIYPYPYGSAQYVLMSTGINKVGGYIYSGAGNLVTSFFQNYVCNLGDASSLGIVGLDFENCNQDKFFLTDNRYSLSLSDTSFYSDDIVNDNFLLETYSDGMWKFNKFAKANASPVGIKPIHSSGRVGIGTDVPTALLDVKGNIKADRAYVKELCLNNNTNCIKPKLFGGNGTFSCAGNKHQKGIITGIDANGNVTCLGNKNSATTFSGITGNHASCTAGTVVYGVNASGQVLCRAN